MVLGIHFVDDAFENTVFVEDEGLAECSHADFAVEFFFAPCAESLKHLGGRVTEQWEGQVVLFLETDM